MFCSFELKCDVKDDSNSVPRLRPLVRQRAASAKVLVNPWLPRMNPQPLPRVRLLAGNAMAAGTVD
jgi:hypothetical protein